MDRTEKHFRWEVSSWWIALLLTLALAALSMAVTVEASDAWYFLTYLVLVAGGALSLLVWVKSDLLRSMNPEHWTRQQRKHAKKGSERRYSWYKFGVSALIVCLVTAAWMGIMFIKTSQDLLRLNGRLYPADDALPHIACGQTEDALMVFMGNHVAISESLPARIISLNGRDILTVDKDGDGALALSFTVYDSDNKIIVQFNRGEFTVNHNNIFRMLRNDRSSLQIIDQRGNTVLNTRFFNRRAIWLDVTLGPIIIRGSTPEPKPLCLQGQNGDAALTFRFQ